MFRLNLITILSLLLGFSLQLIKASTTYYQVALISTATIYLRVESDMVTGVYSSTSYFYTNFNTYNHIIGVGQYDANDNKFDYTIGAPTYGITGPGISFTLEGIYKNLYYDILRKSLVLSSQNLNTLNGPVIISANIIPTDYYQLTLPTTPIQTFYITAVSTYITGLYISLNSVNIPTLNILLPPESFESNDNTFDYTLGYPVYGISYYGIAFLYNGVQTSIFSYNSQLNFQIDQAMANPLAMTFTLLPIKYYRFTINTTIKRVLYLSVVNNIVVGVYTTLTDLKSLTKNLVVPVGSYKNNDNIYDYITTGTAASVASPYGVTYGGISFILDNTLTNVFYNPYVYPSLFLYFSDPLGMVFFTVPVTATAAAISLTSAPTSTPTALPTKAPTHQPTHTPSKQPSRKPTHAPTKAPSKSPTKQPTHTPTAVPTA